MPAGLEGSHYASLHAAAHPSPFDWVAFGGIAQFIAALATVALAGGTFWLARRTREVAEDTRAESVATERLAAEAARDRELQWRPNLQLMSVRIVKGPSNVPVEVRIGMQNTGSGTALGVRGFVRGLAAGQFANLHFGDIIPSGDVSPASADTVSFSALSDLFFDGIQYPASPTSPNPVILFVVFEDVLDRRYRVSFIGLDEDKPREAVRLSPEISNRDVDTGDYNRSWARAAVWQS